MKIAIPGGLGYIGSTLVRFLELEYPQAEITIIDKLIFNQQVVLDKMADLKFRLIQEDVREHQEWSKYDIVINLAAYVGMPLCKKIPEHEVTSLNYDFVKTLCNRLSSRQYLIYPNTNSSYGTSTDNICTENSIRKPLSLYAETKDAAENKVLFKPNGMAFRLATVAGPSPRMRFDLLVNNLCLDAYQNKALKLFEGGVRRNYIGVKDVARGIIFAINNWDKVHNDVFNLGNDEANCTKLQLATLIGHKFQANCYEMPGVDPDKRDYNVSSQKFYNLGFTCQDSLLDIIEDNKWWLLNNSVKSWMTNV